MSTAPFTWYDVRFQCPICGRFIAEKSVHGTDVIDPSEWYGIRVEWTVDCTRCGRLEIDYPRIVQIREYTETTPEPPCP